MEVEEVKVKEVEEVNKWKWNHLEGEQSEDSIDYFFNAI